MLAVIGLFMLAFAWNWYGFALFEEMTEECKANAAGTTEAGTALVIGGVPLVLAHVVGIAALGIVMTRGFRPWTSD
ncbi:hypothetical protein ACSAGD_12945 [Paramicrobacterium sp. CJ85]|uniref:hypothetical protein n=1 Tax=Paramicrobacterium sp. CJ85 TaxID=3445355 RepID=UPI003F61C426